MKCLKKLSVTNQKLKSLIMGSIPMVLEKTQMRITIMMKIMMMRNMKMKSSVFYFLVHIFDMAI